MRLVNFNVMFYKKKALTEKETLAFHIFWLRLNWPLWSILCLSSESWIDAASDNRGVVGTMRGAPLATELQFTARWKGFAKNNELATSNHIFVN